jgi:hypothetical protein
MTQAAVATLDKSNGLLGGSTGIALKAGSAVPCRRPSSNMQASRVMVLAGFLDRKTTGSLFSSFHSCCRLTWTDPIYPLAKLPDLAFFLWNQDV